MFKQIWEMLHTVTCPGKVTMHISIFKALRSPVVNNVFGFVFSNCFDSETLFLDIYEHSTEPSEKMFLGIAKTFHRQEEGLEPNLTPQYSELTGEERLKPAAHISWAYTSSSWVSRCRN